ncbi:MAG: DUF4844 domain-containing protein [Oceanospirillaceae bacterium]|nr:DUF4844 domain-containing protein [Oceanospirillaceae bacterium]MCP5334437.1 DUF4844 domain-containing protein [Oceanospirillaceae bacterium]MCP5350678.1 DUF4844 domain-containing protein [Oceanospirillaceae bacterium]
MLKLILKLILGFIAVFVLLIWLGITGVYFYIWPTFLNDQTLNVTDTTSLELNNLLKEEKFYSSPSEFYFGAPNESIRIEAESKVNLALQEIISVSKNNPKKSEVLSSIKRSLNTFKNFDSEENERALHYFGRSLEILKINSSNELFNVWRYGFPYGWLI